ncbi:Anaphase-promoting complex subunit 7 [Phlyctochytrium planicorne]|nr:Anaphase-promoting complex subunit 7 [Phlyctochytrium planicorne]
MDAKDFSSARELLEDVPDEERSVATLRLLASVYEEVRTVMLPKNIESKPKRNRVLYGCFTQLNCKYYEALAGFKALNSVFKDNPILLLQIAECHMGNMDYEFAAETYIKIRKLEPDIVESMDNLAFIFKDQNSISQLRSLSEELMQSAIERPESWLAHAYYWDSKDEKYEKERAMCFIEKAIALDKNHAASHNAKGKIYLSCGQYAEAVTSFRQQLRLRKDYFAYKDLVESYIGAKRYKEAMIAVKEATEFIPHNARTVTLLGVVLSTGYIPQSPPNGTTMPGSRFGLKEQLEFKPEPILHVRLAEVYLLVEEFDRAQSHYDSALTMDPENQAAAEGLQKVLRFLGGGTDENIDDEMQ